jgi:hypothetical protein
MSKASKKKRIDINLQISKFIDIPKLAFILVLILGFLIAAVLFMLDLDQIMLNKGTVDFSSLIIAAITMSGLSIATYSIGKLDEYTKKNLLTIIIGFIISDIFIFFNLIYAGFISLNLQLNPLILYWFFLFSFFAGYTGLIVFFASTAGLLFLFVKLKFPYKGNKPYGNIFILIAFLIIIVLLIYPYGYRSSPQNNIALNLPHNGQFVNLGATTEYGAGTFYLTPPKVIDGNLVGGNLTIITVGNTTFFNSSDKGLYEVTLSFGVYPGFKQVNLTFYPQILPLRVNATALEISNGTGYEILTEVEGYYRKPVSLYTPKAYFPPGEYTITFAIESVPYNFTIYPNKPYTLYHLFTVDGTLETSQNFLTNFNIYLKDYYNESTFCNAMPTDC